MVIKSKLRIPNIDFQAIEADLNYDVEIPTTLKQWMTGGRMRGPSEGMTYLTKKREIHM